MADKNLPSWRSVAEMLALRLANHASLAGALPDDMANRTIYDQATGCSHTLADADPENCPFCDDRAAYRLYLRKLRAGTGPRHDT